MTSPYKPLIKELKEQGVEIENRTNHLAVRYKGALIAILPMNLKTDGSDTALQNTLAALRRAGLTAGGRSRPSVTEGTQ
jgi:hypothetical protein